MFPESLFESSRDRQHLESDAVFLNSLSEELQMMLSDYKMTIEVWSAATRRRTPKKPDCLILCDHRGLLFK